MSCGRRKSKKKGETRRRGPTTLVQSARENSIVRHSPQLTIRKKYEAISKFGRTEQQDRKGNQRRRNTWFFFLEGWRISDLHPFSPLSFSFRHCLKIAYCLLVQCSFNEEEQKWEQQKAFFLSLSFSCEIWQIYARAHSSKKRKKKKRYHLATTGKRRKRKVRKVDVMRRKGEPRKLHSSTLHTEHSKMGEKENGRRNVRIYYRLGKGGRSYMFSLPHSDGARGRKIIPLTRLITRRRRCYLGKRQ